MYNTIRYDKWCSQKLTYDCWIYYTEPTTKNWKSEKLKTKTRICSEVSVNSPGNPCSQSGRRKGRLLWDCRKGFKPGIKEWRADGWRELWVDGTDGGSATQRTGWVRIGEICEWLTKGSRELIPETRGSILEGTILLFVEKMMWMGERVWSKMKSECCEEAELWWGYADMKVGWLWGLCR